MCQHEFLAVFFLGAELSLKKKKKTLVFVLKGFDRPETIVCFGSKHSFISLLCSLLGSLLRGWIKQLKKHLVSASKKFIGRDL